MAWISAFVRAMASTPARPPEIEAISDPTYRMRETFFMVSRIDRAMASKSAAQVVTDVEIRSSIADRLVGSNLGTASCSPKRRSDEKTDASAGCRDRSARSAEG
jgi:hypothetical protein